jgi:ribose transport system substrate-binding protein
MLLIVGFDLTKSFKNHTKEKPVVYMIVKSSKASEGFEFWEIVKMGADVAATELDVDVIFTGPENETEIDEQIELTRDAIKQKPTAIVLAATDYRRLREVGQEVISNGIALVTIDSQVDIDDEHSFIGTDNIGAAKKIAEELANMIDNKGKVAIIS